MINIIIEERNSFFICGVKSILKEIIHQDENNSRRICFHHKLTHENISQADIIIKYFDGGEEYLCHDELKGGNGHSILIGISDTHIPRANYVRPICLNNCIFMNRKTSLEDFKSIVFLSLSNTVLQEKNKRSIKCDDCKFQTLSGRQLLVAKEICLSHDTCKISKSLGISIKNVSTHKRAIMSNFGLTSTSELYKFLTKNKVKLNL